MTLLEQETIVRYLTEEGPTDLRIFNKYLALPEKDKRKIRKYTKSAIRMLIQSHTAKQMNALEDTFFVKGKEYLDDSH